MTFGKRFLQALGVVALGAIVSAPAIGQVTTKFVAPGGALTSTKIAPGGTATFEVRFDATVGTVGSAYRLTQTSGPAAGQFSITNRVDVGDVTGTGPECLDPKTPAPNPLYVYNDQFSGAANLTHVVVTGTDECLDTPVGVLQAPQNLLNPTSQVNIGRNRVSLANTPAAANILATTITLTANAAAPVGTYRIQPTPTVSFVTSRAGSVFTDFAMDAAFFDIIVGQSVTVTKSGSGTGLVTADSGLINCGAVCTDIYGGPVTLTAAAGPGATFIGWTGGGCSGTGTCIVTPVAATTVNAQFDLAPQPLTVVVAGTGTGTVASVPAGIACAPTCNFTFPALQSVVLTATPGVGSAFTGWSGGGCTGTGTCTVIMNAPITVTATFDLPPFPLTVTKIGNGTGVVTSSVGGINCGATCSASIPSTTVVVLTATPTAGHQFNGWTGVPAVTCPGTGTCSVTILAAQTVTADFSDVIPPVTTILTGPLDPSNSANPVFTFSANESPVVFRCSLDGAPATICTSPATLTVGNGPHVFTVFATDAAGNVSNTATYNWTAAGIILANVPIPTLSEWMLVLLAMVLGTAGMLARRRRN